jgi:hypothetical protein
MFRKTLLSLVGCALLGALTWLGSPPVHAQGTLPAVAATADPSAQQIYNAARAGHLGQAQQMIEQVLRDHPGSANAHYVAAEVYARSGDLARARRELSAALAINPNVANASSIASLERQLSSGRAVYGAPAVRAHGISWGGILLIVAIIAVAYALLRRRTVPAYGQQPYGSYPGQPGPFGAGPYPPQYPGAGYGQPMGGGSGLMGNLATGLAVGAGVAAGEELVGHMLGGSRAGGTIVPSAEAGEPPDMQNADMGGNDFGLNDGSSWDNGGSDPFGGGGGDFGGGDLGGGGGGDWT